MLASLFSGHCGDHLFPGEIWEGFFSLDAQPAILDIFTPCPVKTGTAVLIHPPQVFLNCSHFLLIFPREEITSKKRWFFSGISVPYLKQKSGKGTLHSTVVNLFKSIWEYQELWQVIDDRGSSQTVVWKLENRIGLLSLEKLIKACLLYNSAAQNEVTLVTN